MNDLPKAFEGWILEKVYYGKYWYLRIWADDYEKLSEAMPLIGEVMNHIYAEDKPEE